MRNYSDYLSLEAEHEELSQICARQAVEIERLKARIINFENNSECVHCGAVVPIADADVNHWRECPSHPARAEIERLKDEAHEMRSLLETALDYFESATGPHVSRSWMDTVDRTVNGAEKGGE